MNTSSMDYYINEKITTIHSDLNQTIDFSEVDISRLLEITDMFTESVHSLYGEFDDSNIMIINTNNE